jgi:hypothetical protein
VENSCECGEEPSGSIKCWDTIDWLHIGVLPSSVQVYRDS